MLGSKLLFLSGRTFNYRADSLLQKFGDSSANRSIESDLIVSLLRILRYHFSVIIFSSFCPFLLIFKTMLLLSWTTNCNVYRVRLRGYSKLELFWVHQTLRKNIVNIHNVLIDFMLTCVQLFNAQTFGNRVYYTFMHTFVVVFMYTF